MIRRRKGRLRLMMKCELNLCSILLVIKSVMCYYSKSVCISLFVALGAISPRLRTPCEQDVHTSAAEGGKRGRGGGGAM